MNKSLAVTSQAPASDDIDQDSLEYLFGPRKSRVSEVPWVKLAKEPEPVARISPEMVRLQAKVETMIMQLEIVSGKLESSNLQLGYARAQLAERDAQLVTLSEYRVRAAQSIMSDVEREQLKRRIAGLELQLSDLIDAAASPSNQSAAGQSPWLADFEDNTVSEDVLYALNRSSKPSGAAIPMLPVIYALVLCFASIVLLNILI